MLIHYIGYGYDSYTEFWVKHRFSMDPLAGTMHVRKRPGQKNTSPMNVEWDGIGEMFEPGGCDRWAITMETVDEEALETD